MFFLGTDNYCSIYKVRPKACSEFPHTNRKKFHQISKLTLENVKICPAAFQIIESMRKKLKFNFFIFRKKSFGTISTLFRNHTITSQKFNSHRRYNLILDY